MTATLLRTAVKTVVRRPLGAGLILVVVATATAVALLGLTLLTNANEAYLSSFQAHRGADVAAYISTAHATPRDLAATRHARGVTQMAGPYPALTVTLTQPAGSKPTGPRAPRTTTQAGTSIIHPPTGTTTSAHSGSSSSNGPIGPASLGGRPRGPAAAPSATHATGTAAGSAQISRSRKPNGPTAPSSTGGPTGGGAVAASPGSTQTIVGRAAPGGALDSLTVGPGHWLTGSGQIVLVPYFGEDAPVGSTVIVSSAVGKPALKVVGYAASIGRFGMGWVTPDELARLRPAHKTGTVEILYRFRHAANALQVSADVAALRRTLPAGALEGYDSWIDAAAQTGGEQSTDTAFVLAFGLLGVLLAAIIVASLVSGAVLADFRRIGVLKSIGFTPRQVATTYVAQAAIPAAAGIVVGAIVGNLWVTPQLNTASGLLGSGAQYVPIWLDFAIAAGMLTLVGVAAALPARRAAAFSTVEAITAGLSPQARRGLRLQRVTARIALPRPITLGLAAPLTRPSRAATLLAASAAGATAVLLAVGLRSSLKTVTPLTYVGNGQVSVSTPKGGGQPTLTANQSRAVLSAIRRQPGTRSEVAVEQTGATINSVSALGIDNLNTVTYAGKARWLNWPMINGHWYQRPDQLVVNAEFLTETGLQVGQAVTLQVNHRPVRTRIVGEIYQPNGPSIFTSAQTLGGARAGLQPSLYAIGLRDGVRPAAYAAALQRAVGPRYAVSLSQSTDDAGGGFNTSLITLLTVLIAALSALGVLSAVIMLVRERIHDLGVFKAIGMTPRQTMTTVACSVIVPAALAATISIPIAIALHTWTVEDLGNLTGSGFPTVAIHIYHPGQVALLALSGIAIALLAALIPAAWAASARTTTALRAE